MSQQPTNRIIGDSIELSQTLDRISDVAPLNRPVLIIGERGTGKEMMAERLHFLSPRWDKPYIKINCAAINENLLESELFGHEPGAFTGANRVHHGRFERADGGTLFLDELGTMSLPLQEKLLRLIEYGEFERLGGQKTLQVDVRIVAATNADLPEQAAKGAFREDLLDRLAFDVITLPPLRYRPDDILSLTEHFAIKMTQELGRELFSGFTDQAYEQLQTYSWPGNIRELKNVVERSVYRWPVIDEPIGEIFIDPFINPYGNSKAKKETVLTPADQNINPEKEVVIAGKGENIENINQGSLTERVNQFEINAIQVSLSRNRYSQKMAAEELGISYHQLRAYLKKYPKIKRRADS